MRLLLLIFSAATLSAQNHYYFAQVVDGPAANGSLVTTFAITNPGRTAASVTLSATRDDATPRPLSFPGLGANTTFTLTLPAGATRLLTTDGSGDGTASSATISSAAALSVYEILTNIDPSGAPLSESAAGAPGDQELALEYIVPVNTAAGSNPGVALYNPGKTAASVTLSLLDASGQSAAVPVTLTLAPGAHLMRFTIGDLFPGITTFFGSLDVVSTVPLAAVGLRQNWMSPAFTLVPAANRISHRVRYILPQVTDGPSASGIAQTTFQITNLSAKIANVTMSLAAADNTPLVLNVLGVTSGSTFNAAIPPGGAVYWQTDGLSPTLTNGTAAIYSDQPISASALLTNLDSGSNFVSETSVWPAQVYYQFTVPFDNTGATLTRTSFLNTGASPITVNLNLVGTDGSIVATAQVGPIAPGTQTAGAISDFFPAAGQLAGTLVAQTSSPMDQTLVTTTLRQSTGGPVLSAAPALRMPRVPAGTPAMVVPKLDAARKVSALIPASGGTLSVTDAAGNTFKLLMPAGALLSDETISMTPVISATGVSAPGVFAAVQLEPDGLGLTIPAQLTISLAKPAPPGTAPIGWHGAAPGVYLNPPLPDPNTLTVVLTHFSGAGTGGFDLTSDLLGIANELDFESTIAANLLANARQETLAGDDDDAAIDAQRALDVFTLGWETVVEPMLEIAMASDDEDVMRCAATLALSYERQRQLTGLADDDAGSGIDDAVNDFVAYAMQRADAKVSQRCQQHDFTAALDYLAVQRQMALMGINSSSNVDISSCPPQLQLMFKSEISGNILTGVTGTFDGTVSAKVTLTGNMSKDALTQVVDPSKDLYPYFTLTGSNPETYDSLSLTVNNVPAGCSVTVSSKTPDVLTVKPGADPQLSQVKFKFNPHYDPQALTLNGRQLCSFCPVYEKTPVEVDLWIDPGKPAETLLATCQGVSQTIPGLFWFGGWAVNHLTQSSTYIQNWDLTNTPDQFAAKTINASNSSGGVTLTEKTQLTLKSPAAQ